MPPAHPAITAYQEMASLKAKSPQELKFLEMARLQAAARRYALMLSMTEEHWVTVFESLQGGKDLNALLESLEEALLPTTAKPSEA